MARDESTMDRILDGVLELVATRGPDATTVRNVAAAAGVSVGAVQHHFGTKEELLIAAMEAVTERFLIRLRERIEVISTGRGRLRAFLTAIAALEDTDEARTDAVVWTVFAARATVDPAIRAIHATSWMRVELGLLAALGDAYPDITVTADDAAALLALTDGIAVSRAAEGTTRLPRDRATRIVDQALTAIERRAAEETAST